MIQFQSGRVSVLLAALSLVLTARLHAQPATGQLTLVVRDSSGTPMQAAGKLDSTNSGVSRGFRTDAAGAATIPNLPFGTYRLQVSQPGFITYTSQLEISAAAPVVKTITLTVGAASFKVDVVGITPLGGVEIPVEQIPSPVQTLTTKDFDNTNALDLSELMNRRLNGVHINETQNNPFQPDVNYRGYTASPLLGTPEGISVYMDGVRMNQPFGDVVSWDLIPRIAISEIALIPGSNPVFGLNTLGGALSLQTKSGASRPGTSIQATGGSFGRRAVEFDHGWSNAKGFNGYAAGNLFHDDGWRVFSASDVRQAFSKLGWQGAKTSIGLTGSYADNELIGNGLQETRLLARDYSSVYTLFDRTNNRAPFLNLTMRHTPGANLSFSGNAYFRYIRADSFNGDSNEDALDQSVYQPSAAEIAALRAAGYSGFPLSGANASNTPFPYWRCIGQVLLNDEPGEKCNGVINRSYTMQHNYGLSGQATLLGSFNNLHSQLTVGAGHDRSNVDFLQTAQLGYITPDLNVTGLNAFADGIHAGSVDGEPLDSRVNLRGVIHTSSLYATDTLQFNKALTLTLSGRFNHTVVDNLDNIVPAGKGSLTGRHTFDRFNPAVGITFSPAAAIGIYSSYSEGSRAPTAIELGCADPDQPCKLPNSLAGDPPLHQVVARTLEAGVRSNAESNLAWSVGWFLGQNSNDILFVSSSSTGLGYFRNFGKTRRQGAEVSLRRRIRRVTMGGSYTFLDATFRTPEIVNGSGNSTNSSALQGARGLEGTIRIQAGNRIPLIPQNVIKAWADLQATAKLALDIDFRAAGMSYARGNENNLSQPDGTYYIGPGTSPGYGVTSLGARYQALKRVQLFIQVNNVLNHRYYTGAQLGSTAFTATGNFAARPLPAVNGEFPVPQSTFYAPGSPRNFQGGLKLTF